MASPAVTCPTDLSQVVESVALVESAYRDLDLDAVAANGARLEQVVGCVDGPVAARNVARIDVARALVAWAVGDEAATDSALWGARAASPEFVLDPTLAPAGTPLALRWQHVADHAIDARVVPAPDVTIDGDPTPESFDADRLVLAQRLSNDAWITLWVPGRELPAHWRVVEAEVPVKRAAPTFSVPLLAAGGGLGVLGLGTYAWSGHQAARFNQNELTYDEGLATQSKVRTANIAGMLLISGGAALVSIAF